MAIATDLSAPGVEPTLSAPVLWGTNFFSALEPLIFSKRPSNSWGAKKIYARLAREKVGTPGILKSSARP